MEICLKNINSLNNAFNTLDFESINFSYKIYKVLKQSKLYKKTTSTLKPCNIASVLTQLCMLWTYATGMLRLCMWVKLLLFGECAAVQCVFGAYTSSSLPRRDSSSSLIWNTAFRVSMQALNSSLSVAFKILRVDWNCLVLICTVRFQIAIFNLCVKCLLLV